MSRPQSFIDQSHLLICVALPCELVHYHLAHYSQPYYRLSVGNRLQASVNFESDKNTPSPSPQDPSLQGPSPQNLPPQDPPPQDPPPQGHSQTFRNKEVYIAFNPMSLPPSLNAYSLVHLHRLPAHARVLSSFTTLPPFIADTANSEGYSIDRHHLKSRYGHSVPEAWYQLYESVEFGMIPTPEQCNDAPPSQQSIAKIPRTKTSRKASMLGHFYASSSGTEFKCQVVGEDGEICGHIYKKSGGGGARTKHLINAHTDLHDALREFRFYQCIVQNIELPQEQEDDDTPSTPKKMKYGASRDEVIRSIMKQPHPYELNNFHELIVKLVAVHGAPYSLIQTDTFKHMCFQLNPHYNVPSTNSLQNKMDSSATRKRIEIKSYISRKIKYCAFTADCWTSIDQRKFLGITLHFLTGAYELASVVIGMERTRESHTSEYLLLKIRNVMQQWDLEGKLVCGTTDQGENIKKAMELYAKHAGVSWIPCSSHKIQLCINKALKKSDGANAIIEKCQKISTFFRGSSVAMNVLNKAQSSLHGKQYKLLTMNNTRWNSQYSMAARVLNIIGAITITLDRLKEGEMDEKAKALELGRIMLSSQEIQALREIIALLEPVAQFTHWAGQSSRPTVSQIYPKVHTLIPAASSFNTEQAQELCENLDDFIKKNWSFKEIPDATLLAIFLNPACASLPLFDLITTDDGKTIRDRAKELAIKAHVSWSEKLISQSKLQENESEPLHERTRKEPIQPELNEDNEIQLGADFLRLEAAYAVESYCLSVRSNAEKLKCYIDAPQDYWRNRGSHPHFAKLADVARAHICIQATSNEPERLFSKAGNVLSELRSSMSDYNFRNLIFYKSFDELLGSLSPEELK